MDAQDAAWISTFEPLLRELCERIRKAASDALLRVRAGHDRGSVARPEQRGAGDWSYGLDVACEAVADTWLDEVAARAPLSLLTEDRGWRHRGPAPSGRGAVELAGFDHGGPRIALDPVDGTRNLMFDLRSAWTIVSCAGPGAGVPHLSDLALGMACELPTTRAAERRALSARAGGPCQLEVLDAHGRGLRSRALVRTDGDARADRGYFPFFSYLPDARPAIARVAAEFFARLERLEGAQIAHCYDDQYISSGGQLALLALGSYRMIVDVRAQAGRALGRPTMTAKPYDLAGAVLVARAAGCVVAAPAAGLLDFPLDTESEVDFAGYANAATAARLAPHLTAALQELGSARHGSASAG